MGESYARLQQQPLHKDIKCCPLNSMAVKTLSFRPIIWIIKNSWNMSNSTGSMQMCRWLISWPHGKRLMARNVSKPGLGDSKRKVIEASLILKKKKYSLNKVE